ncbi:hypothetical protein D9M71_500220 [compost metagenome]
MVLGDHAGAAQAAVRAGQQVVQVEQLEAEGQVLDIGHERVTGQILAAGNRWMIGQVLRCRIQAQAIVAQARAHVGPPFRTLQGDGDVRLASRQVDEVRDRQDVH